MKKITSIIICFIITIACCLTTGCAQFKINRVKYYNAVVAKVGDSKITRHQLLSAYNSYGKSKYSDSSESEALKKTLEYLEQQEALYLYALDNIDTYKIGENQLYNALSSIFDTVDNDLKSLKKEAYAILNIKFVEEDADEDADEDEEDEVSVSTTAYTRAEYEYAKRATVVTSSENGETKTVIKYIIKDIEKVDKDEDITEGHKLYTLLAYLADRTAPEKDIVLEIKDSYFRYLKQTIEDELKETAENYDESMVVASYNKVRSLLSKNLIDYEYYLRDENGKAYNTISEDLFTRYFSRIYDSKIKQCFVDNVKTEYFRGLELDADALVEKYNELVKEDFEDYNENKDEYFDALKDAATGSGDTIYYHKNIDDQKIGYFLHTLIKFTSGESSRADELKNNEPDEDKYKENMAEIINNMKIYYRDAEGNYARDDEDNLLHVGIADILAEYANITDLDSFIDFMFKYSQDDSTLKASTPYATGSDDEIKISSNMPYIIGGNNDGVIDEKDLSNGQWKEEFTEEGIRILYSEDTMSKQITTTDGKILAQDVDDFCITSYGIHFLYYVGDIADFDIEYIAPAEQHEESEDSVEAEESNVYIAQLDSILDKTNLYTKLLNIATGETYFDKLFDIVYTTEGDSSEVYAKDNEFEDYAKELSSDIMENSHKKVEYSSILKGTKVSID